jgi:hypothetical protein
MFDFIFGGKRKLELIRELVEQRMRDIGFDDMEWRLKVKEMGNFELMGTPEGTIVTIIENVFKLQKQGLMIGQILMAIENQRKSTGQNSAEFMEILNIASGSIDDAGSAIPVYCFYRMNMEYPDKINEDQFMNAFSQAVNVMSKR